MQPPGSPTSRPERRLYYLLPSALIACAASFWLQTRRLFPAAAAAAAVALFLVLASVRSLPANGWRVRLPFRPPVTREGAAFLALAVMVGLSAIYSGNNLIYLVFSTMLAALLVAGLVSRLGLAGLELRLALPERLFAQQPAVARLSVRNSKRWFPSFAVALAPRPGGDLELEDLFFPLLRPRQQIAGTAECVFGQRGARRTESVVLKTRFPFGFVEREVGLTLREEILIYPDIRPSPESEALVRELEAPSPSRAIGESHDLYRIRPAEPDDEARFLDWKAGARTGGLWVREYSREDQRIVRLVFDRALPAPQDADAKARFERQVTLCAAVVWKLHQLGATIVFLSDEGSLQCRAQTADVFGILEYLARVVPGAEKQPLPAYPTSDAAVDAPLYAFSLREAPPRAASTLRDARDSSIAPR